MADGDVFWSKGISLVEPACRAEDVRPDEEAGSVHGPGPEESFLHGPGGRDGFVDPVQIVLHIAPGGPGGAAAGLHPAVGEDDLRGYDGGVCGQAVEVGEEPVDDGHPHERVVIDDEAVFPGDLPQGEVVVLREAPQLAALDDLHRGPVRLQPGEVLRREPVGHHPDFELGPVVRTQAFQARIQQIRPVHAHDDDTDFRHNLQK